MTAGTIDGVRALDFGKSQHVFAFWTFAIDVRLAVAPFVFLQAEYIFHAIGKIHINAVFLLPRVKIA